MSPPDPWSVWQQLEAGKCFDKVLFLSQFWRNTDEKSFWKFRSFDGLKKSVLNVFWSKTETNIFFTEQHNQCMFYVLGCRPVECARLSVRRHLPPTLIYTELLCSEDTAHSLPEPTWRWPLFGIGAGPGIARVINPAHTVNTIIHITFANTIVTLPCPCFCFIR